MGLDVDADTVQTNIVFLNAAKMRMGASAFAESIRANGVLVNMPGANGRIRFVTHYGISDEDIKRTLVIIKKQLGSSGV